MDTEHQTMILESRNSQGSIDVLSDHLMEAVEEKKEIVDEIDSIFNQSNGTNGHSK